MLYQYPYIMGTDNIQNTNGTILDIVRSLLVTVESFWDCSAVTSRTNLLHQLLILMCCGY